MLKLGAVSTQTKGVPIPGYGETPDCVVPGAIYRCHGSRLAESWSQHCGALRPHINS